MSDVQLERSVLEAKEREELFAIADALGTRPTTRARKADLISQILQATGVEQAPEADERPRRTRARKATGGAAEGADGSPETAGGEAGVAGQAVEGGGAGGDEGPGGGGRAAAGNGSGEAAGATTGVAGAAKVGAGSKEANGGRGSPGRTSGAGATRGGGTRGAGNPGQSGADVGGAGSGPGQSGAGAGGPGREVGGEPAATGGAEPDAPGAARGAGAEAGQRGRRAAVNATSNGAGGAATAGPDQGAGTSLATGRAQGGDRDVSAAPNGADHDNAGHEQAERTSRFDGEPGNRRNRRRRGRDRGDRGERELQGQPGPEPQFSGEPLEVKGFLDLRDEGYGFLRTTGFLPGPQDVYVSISQVRRFALRKGDYVEGAARPASSNEKYPALVRVDTVAGMNPDDARNRPRFENLTPLFPDRRLRLEVPGDPANLTARIVDLISPIGKGQRGLIVSPPKAGKTTILKQIAHSIEANNPDVHLMVLLVDERPEEVTDMRRSVKGEVIASTFDRPAEEHTHVAELAIERARRLVELGRDVVIVLDGITRLTRAYNLAQPATGRVMSGGIDTGALYPPKKFFGAARNVEEGGSLTILATALVETGSRMDEVIFEEFKGTGNMELRLDRRLVERRIYPAIEVNSSSTRHEELLFDRNQLQQVWKLRRVLNALASEGNTAPGLELLMEKIKSTRSNDEFLAEIAKNPSPTV
jgi:transcription termination factor Rho